MSQITTHILDTSVGSPAVNVEIVLYKNENDSWIELASGITNSDGRISDLLEMNMILEFGIYKMKFITSEYFRNKKRTTFFPFIEIVFEVNSSEHYHIPLLLNPFGYTTYRGS